MPLTIVEVSRTTFGSKRAVLSTVTFDSTYPAGGESLTAADIGLSTIDFLLADAALTTTGPAANIPRYNKLTSKLLLFESAAAAADFTEQNTPDQSAKSVTILAIGN